MIYTTLNKILAHGPCGRQPGSSDGWRKLLRHLHKILSDDEPLSLLTILESNGIDDALWALRAVDGYEMEMRELVCDFAEHALPIYMITYLGKATKRKRTAAQDTAWAITRDAVGDTTQDAAWASARTVAWAAARNVAWNASWHAEREWQRATAWEVAFDAEREWQRAHLIEWLNATGEIK